MPNRARRPDVSPQPIPSRHGPVLIRRPREKTQAAVRRPTAPSKRGPLHRGWSGSSLLPSAVVFSTIAATMLLDACVM